MNDSKCMYKASNWSTEFIVNAIQAFIKSQSSNKDLVKDFESAKCLINSVRGDAIDEMDQCLVELRAELVNSIISASIVVDTVHLTADGLSAIDITINGESLYFSVD